MSSPAGIFASTSAAWRSSTPCRIGIAPAHGGLPGLGGQGEAAPGAFSRTGQPKASSKAARSSSGWEKLTYSARTESAGFPAQVEQGEGDAVLGGAGQAAHDHSDRPLVFEQVDVYRCSHEERVARVASQPLAHGARRDDQVVEERVVAQERLLSQPQPQVLEGPALLRRADQAPERGAWNQTVGIVEIGRADPTRAQQRRDFVAQPLEGGQQGATAPTENVGWIPGGVARSVSRLAALVMARRALLPDYATAKTCSAGAGAMARRAQCPRTDAGLGRARPVS